MKETTFLNPCGRVEEKMEFKKNLICILLAE